MRHALVELSPRLLLHSAQAPNFESADPGAPVNPGGLAGLQQEPVANMTPSSPRPPRARSAQMLAASAEGVQKGIMNGEGGGGRINLRRPSKVKVPISKPS